MVASSLNLTKHVRCLLFLFLSSGLVAGSFFAPCSILCAQDTAESSDRQESAEAVRASFNVVVMDPLSAPLACDCVQGYAQRKYEVLGSHLAAQLGVPVRIAWAESLEAGKEKLAGQVDLVIGKHSVVVSDGKKAGLELQPVASLTGKDGETTQTGLVVVRRDDAALTAADLTDYRIFFGPADCDEKHKAPREFLEAMGVELPEQLETSPACSAAATKLMELDADVKAAAIISSYAKPLLEGCGTIKKGDLRVIGESEPVPFIAAFCNQQLPGEVQEKLVNALMSSGENSKVLVALETESGFVALDAEAQTGESDGETQESEKPTAGSTGETDGETVKKKL